MFKENYKINEDISNSSCTDIKKDDESEILKKMKEGKIKEYFSENFIPSVEEFLELKEFIDNEIDHYLNNEINFNSLKEHCKYNIDIRKPNQENFVEMIAEVGEQKAFFESAYKKINGFLKTYDKYIDLLKIYLLLLSEKKKTEAEAEISIRLKEYTFNKQKIEGLLNELAASKDSFETKYTTLSRILSAWQNQNSVNNTYKFR